MNTSSAKLYYLEQLALKPDHHRRIANRLTDRFNVSAAAIKDELLSDGYIKLDKVVGRGNKNHYYYALTDKQFSLDNKQVALDAYWPCGTKKSTGNAFDLSATKGLFSKTEIASVAFRGSPLNYNTPVQVIAYSRA